MSVRINRSAGEPPAWPPRQGRICPRGRRTLPVRAGQIVAMLGLAVIAATVLPGARADAGRTARDPDGKGYNVSRVSAASTARMRPLVFGIYPGGAAGTVGPSGRLVPDDLGKALAALKELRPPGRPFVVHLYASYSGPDGSSAADQVGRDVAQYSAARLQVELVLTYRPVDGGSTSDVAGFAAFARDTVRSLGSNRQFVSLQVTNEANVGGAPNASDGYYAGAKDALIKGVIAAKEQVRSTALHGIKVGFNWAYSTDDRESDFWRYLGRHGGPAFAAAVDWVGLDLYPGTWSPPRDPSDLSGGTSVAVESALRIVRQRYIPLAGIPASVPLHISENGYPTGPGRTEAMQVAAMKAAIAAIESERARYNVTDYRWFDLRDADSTSDSFESRYGLLNDDYSPKAAFAVYRDLVTSLSETRARRSRRRQG